jgi:wyosine [tRNA(Phe)-imidazoG37] synthetase (radical SAM superfamily)
MRMRHPIALFFIAACVFPSMACAANVYKCGNSYSQVPCPGAVEINTSGSPDAMRQRAARKEAEKEKKAANAMEKQRLAEERAELKAQQQAEKARLVPLKADEKESPNTKKKSPKEPPYFTAKVPATKASQPK